MQRGGAAPRRWRRRNGPGRGVAGLGVPAARPGASRPGRARALTTAGVIGGAAALVAAGVVAGVAYQSAHGQPAAAGPSATPSISATAVLPFGRRPSPRARSPPGSARSPSSC